MIDFVYMKYLLIAVGILAAGGIIFGVYTANRNDMTQPATQESLPIDIATTPAPAKVTGLCIDILKLQTQLPLSRYSITNAENMVGVARDGKDRFVLYPLVPGLQVTKEYPHVTEVFSTNSGQWKVYQNDFNYYVQAPLPFVIFRSDNTATPADIETFIKGLTPVIKCDPQNVVYRKEINSLDQWLASLTSTQKAGIESAYAAGSAPYRSVVSEEVHMAAPLCSMYRTEKVVASLSPTQRTNLLKIYNAPYIPSAQSTEADFFTVSSGSGSSSAGRFVGDALSKRLYAEFTKAAILEADSRLGGTYYEVKPVSETDCNGLPK